MILDIRSLSKTFPGQVALNEATLQVESGQIHALVGQNGSGKSTLIKLLTGYHDPDSGADVEIEGEQANLTNLSAANRERIHVMHQDLGLVNSLNAIENLALGRGFHTGFAGRINWNKEAERVTDHLATLGVQLDVRRPVGDLTEAERSMLALARATQDWTDNRGILILDEPTASLPRSEVERLFAAVRELANQGAGVLFVSHRLDEVFELCDHVTVLRDGRTVASRPIGEFDHNSLIHEIVGRNLDDLYGQHGSSDDTKPARAIIEDVWGRVVNGVSMSLGRGEIVGVAGLTGSGREEIGRLVFDTAERFYGRVVVDEAEVAGGIPGALTSGVAYVPADRKNLGSIQSSTVRANMMLPSLRRFMRGLRFDRRAQDREAAEWIERVDVRPPDPDAILATLSGGNQQKTVLARWLLRDPSLLILDEPTQGVDVGAKASIYQLLSDAAATGTSVLMASSDTEELAHVCDRVLVLREGRIAAELSGASLNEDVLTQQIWSFDE